MAITVLVAYWFPWTFGLVSILARYVLNDLLLYGFSHSLHHVELPGLLLQPAAYQIATAEHSRPKKGEYPVRTVIEMALARARTLQLIGSGASLKDHYERSTINQSGHAFPI